MLAGRYEVAKLKAKCVVEADHSKVAQHFPQLSKRGPIRLQRQIRPPSDILPSALRVGVVLSGGQAPGKLHLDCVQVLGCGWRRCFSPSFASFALCGGQG
jgi:hypothetical protein